ncbi:MAG: TonB-dependent receptor plug domain-containing protein, partial [Campylobacteraceae bacterium]|nr:TonB-dependent receptor plug domain-containing protein [Campylobacteraceae bacterium]
MASTPTPTNSVTDTLRTNSNIQFSQNSRSSSAGGEITPPRISIRGSQHYENNFMINGVSNNNNINPGDTRGTRSDETSYGVISGEAQSLFIDTSLIDGVETYTENIGAEYGGFTGGVVDAKLKDARMDRWHIMTNFRYTKDTWAKYHLTDEQKNINQSTSTDYQPEFNKYEYSIFADGPVNDNLGLLLSYGKQHSKIPLWSGYDINASGNVYKERRIQYRDNDNFLIRLNTHNIDDLEASLTAIYAPYTNSDFRGDTKNNDRDRKSGGLNIAYDMKNALNFGVLKNTLAYKSDEVSSYDKNHYYSWGTTVYDPSSYFNWSSYGYTTEGAYGDRELTSENLIYKGVLDFDEIETGILEHSVKTGIEIEAGKARYKRETGYGFMGIATKNSSLADDKDNGIYDGIWLDTMYIVSAQDNKQSYTTAALFLEDTIKYDRYTFRTGLRISTDTVTDNTDIAPRLFANADIFDDESLNVYGGYNRYYGGLILYNSIYHYENNKYKRTSHDANWTYDNYKYLQNTTLDDIKTPYSDEFSLGASLSKWDTNFKLDFVSRKHRYQLKTKNINDVSHNTNDGKSDYWGLTLMASKEYEFKNTKHFSEFSITKSKASTNLNGMNSFMLADVYSNTHITYDGELKKYEDVPSPDYNAPIVITYFHIAQIGENLKLGLNARYEQGVDGYKWVSDSGGLKDHNNVSTRVYESKRYKDSFTVDLSLSYDLKFRKDDKLTFGLEILNALNRKNDADYSSSNSFVDGYAMGRQFYANV